MRHLPLILSILFLLNLSVDASPSSPARSGMMVHSRSQSGEQRAITRVLTQELNHETSGHVRIRSWTLTRLDVDSSWALARVQPTRESQLDPVIVLMHKYRTKWNVVTLGTNLHGSGKQFGVPRRLWQKWSLEK